MDSRLCANCGQTFEFVVGRGNVRKHCSKRCRDLFRNATIRKRHGLLPKCKTEFCNAKANRVGSGMCEACYCQFRRTGSVERRPFHYQWRTQGGYFATKADGHPLGGKTGVVLIHRKVVYDFYHGECQPCYWCGCGLSWDAAVVDHLNDSRQDNRIENLVIACNNCNRWRGSLIAFLNRISPSKHAEFIELVRARFNESANVPTDRKPRKCRRPSDARWIGAGI